MEGNGIKLYHSHTNDTLPSRDDFEKLLNPRVGEIGVVTRNRDVFRASVGSGWVPDYDEYRMITRQISNVADSVIFADPDFDYWTYSERKYMAIREQAYQIASEFKWCLEGGKLK